MALKEYKPGTTFPRVIGRTIQESSPAWPMPVRAKENAPNVIFVVLDDVGYGQLSCFGGLIDTPNLDRLAKNGLRYSNFHTTAICSPTRVCMLTGRNHHSNAMSCITEGALGFPGCNGYIPFENGFRAAQFEEVLSRNFRPVQPQGHNRRARSPRQPEIPRCARIGGGKPPHGSRSPRKISWHCCFHG